MKQQWLLDADPTDRALVVLIVVLMAAHAAGPFWEWPARIRAGRRVPTPRHALRTGRRDVVEVCAEFDESWLRRS